MMVSVSVFSPTIAFSLLVISWLFLSASSKLSDNLCGGNISLESQKGEIFSPNYPYDTPENVSCVWDFQGEKGFPLLFLHFDDLDISSNDYLSISEKNSNNVFNFTGKLAPFTVIVSSTCEISFHVGSSVNSNSSNRRFHAYYNTQDCTVNVATENFIFSAPLYARRSEQTSVNCTWIITGPRKAILLSFSKFKLNTNEIHVYSGYEMSAQPVVVYKGTTLPNDVVINNYQLVVVSFIELSTDVIEFTAETRIMTPECCVVANISSSTVISQNVSSFESTKCVWIFQSPASTTLLAKYVEVNLKNLDDDIIINDGGGRYSPNLNIVNFNNRNNSGSFTMTKSNLMYIYFSSTPILGLSFFKLSISAQTLGGNFYDQGDFKLAPNSSKSGNDVIFTLFAKPNLQIEVTVEAENLTPQSQILFYDIQDNSEKLLTIFNKDTKFYPVFSMSNKMRIVARGFTGSATMSGNFHSIPTGCDAFDRTFVGSYHLQQKVKGNCTWLIKPDGVKENGIVALTLSTLDLSGKDTVSIYQGFSNSAENNIQVFNSSTHVQPVLYIPVINGVRIDFQVENDLQDMQVTAFYEMQQGCDNNITINEGDNLRITSVGYPGHYPLNVNCSWIIHNPSNRTLFVAFTDIDLYPQHNLSLYSVKNDSKKLLLTTSGQSYPDDLIMIETKIIVEWNFSFAYGYKARRGFLLQINTLQCGENVTTSSGVINTPRYPLPVNDTVTCIWGISVPHPKSSSSVNIIQLLMSDITATDKDSSKLEIHDGGSLSSELLFPPSINQTELSRSNKLLIKYTNEGNEGRAYKLSFNSKECDQDHQCKNKICMHPSWRCNGINDCGDFSDEENCDSLNRKPGVSMAWFGVSIVLSLFLGFAFTICIPWSIKKVKEIRERRRNYNDLPTLSEDTENYMD